DALYGRPRQDGSMLREARRAAEPGTQTDKPSDGRRTSLTNRNQYLCITLLEFTTIYARNFGFELGVTFTHATKPVKSG
ncbi:hypothetical protein ACFL3I_11660, partial [Pseudomonadota bacterium]